MEILILISLAALGIVIASASTIQSNQHQQTIKRLDKIIQYIDISPFGNEGKE